MRRRRRARHGRGRTAMLRARSATPRRGPARRLPGPPWPQRSTSRSSTPRACATRSRSIPASRRRVPGCSISCASSCSGAGPRSRPIFEARRQRRGRASRAQPADGRAGPGHARLRPGAPLRQLQPDHRRGAGRGRGRRLRPAGAGARLGHRPAVPVPLQAHAACRAGLGVPALQAVGPRPEGRPGGPLGAPRRIKLAKSDLTVQTALLEARLLWGSRRLFAQLRRSYEREIVAGRGAGLRRGQARRARPAPPAHGRFPLHARAQHQGGQGRPARPADPALDRPLPQAAATIRPSWSGRGCSPGSRWSASCARAASCGPCAATCTT